MKNGDVTLKYYSIAVKKWKKRIFKQSLLCDRNFSQQQCLAKMCQQLETFLSKNYHCLMNRPCKFAKSQTDALRGKLPLATPFRIIDIMIEFDRKIAMHDVTDQNVSKRSRKWEVGELDKTNNGHKNKNKRKTGFSYKTYNNWASQGVYLSIIYDH